MTKLEQIQIGAELYDLRDKEAGHIHYGADAPSDTSALWVDTSDNTVDNVTDGSCSNSTLVKNIVGELSDLSTANKTNIVAAINEIDDKTEIIYADFRSDSDDHYWIDMSFTELKEAILNGKDVRIGSKNRNSMMPFSIDPTNIAWMSAYPKYTEGPELCLDYYCLNSNDEIRFFHHTIMSGQNGGSLSIEVTEEDGRLVADIPFEDIVSNFLAGNSMYVQMDDITAPLLTIDQNGFVFGYEDIEEIDDGKTKIKKYRFKISMEGEITNESSEYLISNDVGNKASKFVVTVTEDGENYTADKTFEEINEAFSKGKTVVAIFDGAVLNLLGSSAEEGFAAFYTITEVGATLNSGILLIYPDGSVVYTVNSYPLFTEEGMEQLFDIINTSIADASSASTTAQKASDKVDNLEDRVSEVSDELKAFLDVTDEELDQLSEVIELIQGNSSLIEGITTSKVNVADIVNNLTTNVTNKPLSAAQGVALKALIDKIVIPTKVSQLENDKSYATNSDLSSYATKESVESLLPIVIQTEEPTDKKVLWIDPDDEDSNESIEIPTLEQIVQSVIATIGTPIAGTIDDDNNITLGGDLADGTYTVRWVNTSGYAEIAMIAFENGSIIVPDKPEEPVPSAPDTTIVWEKGLKIDSSTGVETTGNAAYSASNYIEIVDGYTYELTKTASAEVYGSAKVCYYNADKTFMSTSAEIIAQNTSEITATVPIINGAKYFRIRQYGTASTLEDGHYILTATNNNSSGSTDSKNWLNYGTSELNGTTIYNSKGWKEGTRWSSSGKAPADSNDTVCCLSGIIPVTAGDTVYAYGLSYESNQTDHPCYFVKYGSDGSIVSDNITSYTNIDSNNVASFEIPSGVVACRLMWYGGITATSSITINHYPV